MDDLEQVLLVAVRLLATIFQPGPRLEVLAEVVEAVAEPGRKAQRVEDRVEEAGVPQVGQRSDPRGKGTGGGVPRAVPIHCAAPGGLTLQPPPHSTGRVLILAS